MRWRMAKWLSDNKIAIFNHDLVEERRGRQFRFQPEDTAGEFEKLFSELQKPQI